MATRTKRSGDGPRSHYSRSGQLVARGERTWLLRVYLGRDQNGRRKYKNRTAHGTKKEAQSILDDLLGKKARGSLTATSRERLGDYLDRWISEVAIHKVHARTLSTYEYFLAKYIRPELGHVRLCDLTVPQLQAVYSGLLGRGMKPRTVQLTHGILRVALKTAVAHRLLEHNPAQGVQLPTVGKSKSKAIEGTMLDAFVRAATQHEQGAPFLFAVATGMRPGEYGGLRWQNVDLDTRVAKVDQALCRVPGEAGWRLKRPKTEAGVRLVPLNDLAITALRKQKVAQAQAKLAAGQSWQEHGLVFTTEIGTPINFANYTWRFLKRRPGDGGGAPRIFEMAGMPSTFRLYDLRHTFGTHAVTVTDPKTVAELMGHTRVQTTLDLYTHPDAARKREAVEKLSGVYGARTAQSDS